MCSAIFFTNNVDLHSQQVIKGRNILFSSNLERKIKRNNFSVDRWLDFSKGPFQPDVMIQKELTSWNRSNGNETGERKMSDTFEQF